MQRVEYFANSVIYQRLAAQKRAVQGIAGLAQLRDIRGRHASIRGEVPCAFSLNEKEFDVLLFGQCNVHRRQDLLCREKVETLGVDEDAVVIPEYGLNHVL